MFLTVVNETRRSGQTLGQDDGIGLNKPVSQPAEVPFTFTNVLEVPSGQRTAPGLAHIPRKEHVFHSLPYGDSMPRIPGRGEMSQVPRPGMRRG